MKKNSFSAVILFFVSSAIATNSDLCSSTSVTPDNTCGGDNAYTCNPNAKNGGPCCSSAGFCGRNETYCGAGCQWAYSTPGCKFSQENICGPKNGFTCKPNEKNGGPCCSSKGFCGISEPYCGNGCQAGYGSCFGQSPPATETGGMYVVGGVGAFTTYKTYTFETDNKLPKGLVAYNFTVHDRADGAPYNHHFDSNNVSIMGGFLRLLVPGGQTKSPIQCAEVDTVEEHILYGSVRTFAMFSDVPGTCHGQFFYKSDRQEIDIEYITDPNSESNPKGSQPMMYTNQAADGNPKDATYATSPSPQNRTTAVHEYRIDWIKGKSMFYLDGVLQRTFTTNVPTKAGSWIWNNWSNGDKGFTVGPPKDDNIFLIQRIEMYYNTTT